MKLDKEMKEKRPELANGTGVIFHQDNARSHTSLVTRKKLLELGWKVMPHPPYSLDLAPSDYHLSLSLQNHLNGKTFDSNEAVKNESIQYFASKNQTFYESGIMKLSESWQKAAVPNENVVSRIRYRGENRAVLCFVCPYYRRRFPNIESNGTFKFSSFAYFLLFDKSTV